MTSFLQPPANAQTHLSSRPSLPINDHLPPSSPAVLDIPDDRDCNMTTPPDPCRAINVLCHRHRDPPLLSAVAPYGPRVGPPPQRAACSYAGRYGTLVECPRQGGMAEATLVSRAQSTQHRASQLQIACSTSTIGQRGCRFHKPDWSTTDMLSAKTTLQRNRAPVTAYNGTIPAPPPEKVQVHTARVLRCGSHLISNDWLTAHLLLGQSLADFVSSTHDCSQSREMGRSEPQVQESGPRLGHQSMPFTLWEPLGGVQTVIWGMIYL